MLHFEPFRALRDMDRMSSQLLSGTRTPLAVPMDVWREGQTYHVALDLPGVSPDRIDLRVERNTLTVTAERSAPFAAGEAGQEGVQVVVAERPMGSFTRQLVLGEGLDAGAVSADYTDGVLHLTIPLAQAAQPRRITISSSASSAAPRVVEGEQGGAAPGSGSGSRAPGGS